MSYHSVPFGGHKHSGSRYVMVLVCHVILEDQVIKGSCNFMGEGVLLQFPTQANFVAISIVVVEI